MAQPALRKELEFTHTTAIVIANMIGTGIFTTTGFLAGDGFTYADINLLPALAFLHDCPESCDAIAALENLTAYFKKHSARPSFVKTVPPSFAELRQAG